MSAAAHVACGDPYHLPSRALRVRKDIPSAMAPSRRRGGYKRRGNMNRRSVHRQIHKSEKGFKIRVPADPPSFQATPWWPVTISVILTTETDKINCFAVSNLFLAFQRQTKITTKEAVFRVQRIRMWELNKNPIFVSVDETVDGTECRSYSDSVFNLQDWPGANSFARIGCVWPSSSRNQAVTQAELSRVLFRYSTIHSSPGNFLCYLDVLWTVPDRSSDGPNGSLPGMPVNLASAPSSPPSAPSPAWEMA